MKKIGNKIIIIGSSGSGKSTISKKIHEITNIPLYHLDNIWWKPDMTNITREEFDQRVDEILLKSKWIIDGDYSRTYEKRFSACDSIIFLDYSVDDCMEGIKSRVGQVRSDIPWVEKSLNLELVELVKGYPNKKRPIVLELLNKYAYKQIIIFKNRDESDKWLNDLLNDKKGE